MVCPFRARRRAWLLHYRAIGHVVELNRAAARVGMDGDAGRCRIGQAKIVGRRHAFKEQKCPKNVVLFRTKNALPSRWHAVEGGALLSCAVGDARSFSPRDTEPLPQIKTDRNNRNNIIPTC